MGCVRSVLGLVAAFAVMASVWAVPVRGGAAGDPEGLLPEGVGWLEQDSEDPEGQDLVQTFSPDMAHVVVAVTGGEYGDDNALVSVPLDGGPPVRIDESSCGTPTEFNKVRITPDSMWVLYRSVSSCGEALMSVPIDGSADPIEIATGVPIQTYNVTGDSSTVVFRTAAGGLQAAPVRGGAAVQLSAPSHVFSLPSHYDLSPDESMVVYEARRSESGPRELFSVPLTGGPTTRLNQDLTAGGNVIGDRFTPDGEWVVYQADADIDGRIELFSVPTSGGAPVRLNAPLTEGGNVHDYRISADSRRVVYTADGAVDQQYELYSVRIDGTDLVKLNPDLVPSGDVNRSGPLISPDGAHVLYRADAEVNGVRHVYLVPITGGPSRKLSADLLSDDTTLEPDRRDKVIASRPSPSWSHVVFEVRRDGSPALYSVPLAGGPPASLAGSVREFINVAFTPDESRVILRARPVGDDRRHLYSVPIDGGPMLTLNKPLGRNESVTEYLISPPGTDVVYTTATWERMEPDLWAVPVEGGEVVQLTNPAHTAGQVALPFRFVAPNRLAFAGDLITPSLRQWFAVDLPARCAGQAATIVGTDEDDIIAGTDDADVIAALGGNDRIDALGGDDLVCAGEGDDRVLGRTGADVIYAGPGADSVSGGRGADTIYGQAGDDTLSGNRGRDTIYGGRGRDQIRGGPYHDTLRGGPSADILRGNRGNDRLNGQRGSDTCRGGPGADTETNCET